MTAGPGPKVAVLCASRKSIYKTIPDLDVYDIDRDARTFKGGIPVIAHPPCRLWSAFCRHQAKSPNPQSEKELGRWCVKQVWENGGILEQPAYSRLWSECGLPKPGDPGTSKGGFSIGVSQFWFGDPRSKWTWLWFVGISPRELPEIPLVLKPDGGDRRTWQLMSSKNQREKTPVSMAQWLVRCATLCNTHLPPVPASIPPKQLAVTLQRYRGF